MSGAPDTATPVVPPPASDQAPPAAIEQEAPASLPSPPRPAQGLTIILKPGLQRQADLPETGAAVAGGAAPSADPDVADQGVDADAEQAAAASIARFQATQVQEQPFGTQEAKATTEVAAPAARTLRDVIMGDQAPQAAAAGARGAAQPTTPGSVLGDVAVGVAETPKAVVGGVRNAAEEIIDTAGSVGKWLDKNVGDIGGLQIFDNQGRFDPKYFPSMAEADAAGATSKPGAALPAVGAPRSTTGNIISGITQFVTGYAIGGKLLGAYADAAKVGKVASTFVRSAFSDAFAFDPAQERLSNLIQSVPALQNPVNEFLAAAPDDSEAMGRLKNALEGLGVGAAIQGVFVTALRGMRAARAMGHAPPPVTSEEVRAALGASDAPMMTRTRVPKPSAQAAATMSEAERKASGIKPGQIAQAARGEGLKAFHGTPHEFEQFDVSRIGSGEGAQAYGYGLYFAEDEGVARFYQRKLSGHMNVMVDGKAEARPSLTIPDSELTAKQLALQYLQLYPRDAAHLDDALRQLASDAGKQGASGGASAQTYRDAIKWIERNRANIKLETNSGTMYEVRIDAKPDELLQWDLPFSEQPAPVRRAIEQATEGRQTLFSRKALADLLKGDPTGKQIYEMLTGSFGIHETGRAAKSAQLMQSVGLKGLRYLDQGSRILSAGEKPSYNYVIFHHDNVRVTGKSVGGGAIEPVVGVSAQALQPQVSINFSRIEAPEDVKAALQQAADIFSEDIGKAQRGKISLADTKDLADNLGMSVEDLLSRRRGANGARSPFTAEEAVAARRLLTEAGTQLLQLARLASGPNAGQIDLFNFRRMMAVHYAIQQEVLGARTETARALSAWRIPAGSGEQQVKAIQAALESAGDAGGTLSGVLLERQTTTMARALAVLDANTTTPGSLAQAVRKGVTGKTMDAIREAYIGGLLSNPPTHIVNTLGNLMAAGQQIYERRVASSIGRVVGTPVQDGVSEVEASAMSRAFLSSQGDAFRLAWKALRTGETTDLLGKVDAPRPGAISAEAWGLRNNSIGGRVVDVLGRTFRTPMLLMGSADQYFKTINYRMELAARASSQAVNEGLQGPALSRRIAQLMSQPPEDMRIASADQGLYATFNNQMGWFGKTMMSLREGGGALNPTWMVMTFVRTPVNLTRYAFERTPLAPLVGQWRADIAAGGRRRDIALSRMATGTVIMGITQAMAEGGQITGKGPNDPGERANWLRQGHLPYSVKIGERWYSYSRDSTFGTVMGFAADMQDTLGRSDVAPDKVDEWQEVVAGGIGAISKTALDKTFLSGVSGFMDMASDPERYAPSEIDRQMASFVPFTGIMGGATRLEDQTIRDVRNPWQAVEAKIPGLASQLIPRRDLWGQPVTRESGLGTAYDVVSPFQAAEAKPEPIDAEMERLRAFPQGIGWKTSVNNVAVDFSNFPQTLDRYRALAGNEWKHPAFNMGLKDFLNSVVDGKSPLSSVYRMYSDGEQGGKQAFIRKWVQDYREGAAHALLDDPKYAQFKAYWNEQKEAQRALKQRIAAQ